MKNNFNYKETLLCFLKGKKELINELVLFYAKDQKGFIDYILEQKLENVFCRKLKEYEINTNIVPFFKTVEKYEMAAEQENIVKVRIGSEFIDFFNKNNIKITPYKGFVYSFLAFNNPFARRMVDLDFLLEKPKDIFKIFDLAKENKSFIFENSMRMNKADFYWYLKSSYQEITVKYKNVSFDLHYCLRDLFYFFPRANYPWWNDFGTENLLVEGKSIIIPKKEIFLLEIICHNTHHNWEQLNMPFDMSYLLKNNIFDWELIKLESKKLGFTNILNKGLLYVYEITGVEPYPNFSKFFQKKSITEEIRKMKNENINKKKILSLKIPLRIFVPRFFLSIKEKETFFDKIFTILDYVFVPTKRNYEILKLPKQLYFLYYVFNPLFMIFNRVKNPAKNME
jgi:hypothetical protein